MDTTVDSAFIRRAVEQADLNAVRVTLYQHTGDPEIAALPTAINLDDAGRELLISKAAAWLEQHAGPGMPSEPPEAELRALMNMATAEEMGDLEFEARRNLPAFKDFPFVTEWPDAKPPLPDGFQVVVVGSGWSGLAMCVQLERLDIPYVAARAPARAGWHLDHQPLSRHPRRHDLHHLRVQLREGVPVVGVLRARRRGARVPRLRLPEVRRLREDALQPRAEAGDVRRSPRRLGARGRHARRHRDHRGQCRGERGGHLHQPEVPRLRGPGALRGAGRAPVALAGRPRPHRQARRRHRQRLHRRPAARPGRGRRRPRRRSSSAPRSGSAPATSTARPWSPRSSGCSTTSRATGTGGATWPSPRCSRRTASSSPDEEWKSQGGKFNPMNDKLREDLTAYIKAQTGGRQDLIDKLIPDYAPFSRRPVVDNGWYQALTRDNVELITDGIARWTPKGIETDDGTVHESRRHRHGHRFRDHEVPLARRLHRQGRRERPRLLVEGRSPRRT